MILLEILKKLIIFDVFTTILRYTIGYFGFHFVKIHNQQQEEGRDRTLILFLDENVLSSSNLKHGIKAVCFNFCCHIPVKYVISSTGMCGG
jgi:hypothetical protein